jgi:hypothetical protein
MGLSDSNPIDDMLYISEIGLHLRMRLSMVKPIGDLITQTQ